MITESENITHPHNVCGTHVKGQTASDEWHAIQKPSLCGNLFVVALL